MSSNPKFAATSDAEPVRGGNFYRLAVVGAATLKGKELIEVLNERNFPSLDLKLLDDDDSIGQLESAGDEVTFIQSVRTEQFENLDFVFFVSDSACTAKNWKTAQKAGSAIVDLTYTLEDEPDAAIRSPWVERQLGQTLTLELQPRPVVVAHPAAVVLALLLLRIAKAAPIKRVVATVFEPASEHGQKGMDELHEQTVNLLSFQPMPKKIFDAQVAFNMVSRYGEQSVPALAAIENRVRTHYQRIAGSGSVLPSLLVVQAPVFHGHVLAIHVETASTADLEAITQALAGEHVNVTGSADEAPSNVNAAGQDAIEVSITADANQPNGFWLWAAADNLRVAAANAVECAESMAASRPRGKIQ
jgi:aspartate-semialdehyde dehydrogenase